MTQVSLLLPELKRCVATPAVARGVLARWFARGDRGLDADAGIEPALKTVFQWPGTRVPIAALTRQFDVGDAMGSAWLRADPAHVRADMTTARMLACGDLGLDASECAQIARSLKPLFGDSGFEFDARLPNRWYLRAAVGSELPDAASPDEAMGDDLKLHLPEGTAGRRWRVLFNEVQVLLHNHPVNAARTERGAVSVNSLWFWGAGVLPAWVRSEVQQVFTNGIAITELARLANVRVQPVDLQPLRDAIGRDAGQAVLIDLCDLRGESLEHDWLQAIDALLRSGRIKRLRLLLESGERVNLRAAHRFRVWRSVRSLDA